MSCFHFNLVDAAFKCSSDGPVSQIGMSVRYVHKLLSQMWKQHGRYKEDVFIF